jgi:hypothetical protein
MLMIRQHLLAGLEHVPVAWPMHVDSHHHV